jgi:(2Fe-2S) ferredoxin
LPIHERTQAPSCQGDDVLSCRPEGKTYYEQAKAKEARQTFVKPIAKMSRADLAAFVQEHLRAKGIDVVPVENIFQWTWT